MSQQFQKYLSRDGQYFKGGWTYQFPNRASCASEFRELEGHLLTIRDLSLLVPSTTTAHGDRAVSRDRLTEQIPDYGLGRGAILDGTSTGLRVFVPYWFEPEPGSIASKLVPGANLTVEDFDGDSRAFATARRIAHNAYGKRAVLEADPLPETALLRPGVVLRLADLPNPELWGPCRTYAWHAYRVKADDNTLAIPPDAENLCPDYGRTSRRRSLALSIMDDEPFWVDLYGQALKAKLGRIMDLADTTGLSQNFSKRTSCIDLLQQVLCLHERYATTQQPGAARQGQGQD